MSDINPKNKEYKSEGGKGISVLYVVFIMSILLGISLGISGILVSQIKMVGEIGHSVVVFYAADSGIERVLVERRNPNLTPGHYNGSLPNGATYRVLVLAGGSGDCPPGKNYCIRSIGTFQKTKRAIEISY